MICRADLWEEPTVFTTHSINGVKPDAFPAEAGSTESCSVCRTGFSREEASACCEAAVGISLHPMAAPSKLTPTMISVRARKATHKKARIAAGFFLPINRSNSDQFTLAFSSPLA